MLSIAINIMVFLIWSSTSQTSVNLTADCTFSINGNDFDLNPARKGTDYTGFDSEYTYVLNFCGITQGSPDCQSKNGMCCQYGDGGVIEAAVMKDDAVLPTAQLLDESNPGKGIRVKYDNGDLCYQTGFMGPRHAILSLTCSSESEDSFSITETPQCTHNIALKLRAACPAGFVPAGEGGLSGGSLFLILFFVFLILYCAGGFVFKTKKKGTTGMESIPNIDIWRQAPGLIKDGCIWSHMMIKTKGKGDTYEEI